MCVKNNKTNQDILSPEEVNVKGKLEPIEGKMPREWQISIASTLFTENIKKQTKSLHFYLGIR
ncbi:hypothetical protein SK128_021148 [Halocaridina rubra]|uniref:Uncharacterized protein n=1 Tax=Halocaridina rubra TaxID=373956 RepID=A0AAN9A2U1_HALRR